MTNRHAAKPLWGSPRGRGKHSLRGALLLLVCAGAALSGCAVYPAPGYGYGPGHHGYGAPAYAHAPAYGHHGGWYGVR